MGILENVTRDLNATQERILYMDEKKEEFNPLALLAGTQTREEKMYTIDCIFLHELELLVEKHRKDINAAALGR